MKKPKKFESMSNEEVAQTMAQLCEIVAAAAMHMGLECPMFALLVMNNSKMPVFGANCDKQIIVRHMRDLVERLEKAQDLEFFPVPKPRSSDN